MECYSGKPAYKDIAIGEIFILKKPDNQVRKRHVESCESELSRYREARDEACRQLGDSYERALETVGESGAAIFEAHRMMLEDEDYNDAIEAMISEEGANAEFAVAKTGDNFADIFAGMEDEYMQARSEDIRDISNRVVRILNGVKEEDICLNRPSIIVAEDLTPGDTVSIDRDKVLAFVTVKGSASSHAAILARIMNIPALFGVEMDLNALIPGTTAIVDGFRGRFILKPSMESLEEAELRRQNVLENRKLLDNLKGMDNITVKGKKIHIYANVGSVSDVGYVLENDAGGIGLFRSEFMYLGRGDFPSEEEQFNVYRQVLQTMGRKKVIIRTLDIGADKNLEYFHLEKEDNPALGLRGIRICLKRKDIFKTQLRALFRASLSGNLSIMYPMIISVGELIKIREIVQEVREELNKEGFSFKEPEQGIMIETPAAALIADELAPMVDFFSIGTNDLTQYTLAIDRQNGQLEDYVDKRHPAILKLINMCVEAAHRHGKWVGICGELAGDPLFTETFVKMGVDELSVPPSYILRLRKAVREMDI